MFHWAKGKTGLAGLRSFLEDPLEGRPCPFQPLEAGYIPWFMAPSSSIFEASSVVSFRLLLSLCPLSDHRWESSPNLRVHVIRLALPEFSRY